MPAADSPLGAFPYADQEDLERWAGRTFPDDQVTVAIADAARLFITVPQVLPLDDQPDVAMRDAVCAQVEYWYEIGAGYYDRSQDILRLPGPASVGSMVVPSYQVIAPRAVQVFQAYGNWNPGLVNSGRFSEPWQSWRW